jgi:hypothetical protein
MRGFKHADRARRLVRIGCCSFRKKERKPPKPVVVGSKPTGPASTIGYKYAAAVVVVVVMMIASWPTCKRDAMNEVIMVGGEYHASA